MSRDLPARPSLEHLKKQAKETLRSLASDSASVRPTLADAQHLIAREYGFLNWAALKTHVESLAQADPSEMLAAAVRTNDAGRAATLLRRHPDLGPIVNGPMPGDGFGTTMLMVAVRRENSEMIDLLLRYGADINGRSEWWAGGFGVLDICALEFAPALIGRGAEIDVHAAARLGMVETLDHLVTGTPALVHARGGDGQTPLHVARTIEVAQYLLDHGADLDARDIDHESTPAQYLVRERQSIARLLVRRGARTDILMAAALGDVDLVRRHLNSDPGCIRMSVSEEWFPKQDPRAGGTIYIWQLGAHRTAHSVARDFGHEDVFQLLLERTPQDLKLSLACELGDQAVFQEFLSKHPDVAKTLSEADQRKLPNAAQVNNTEAVRLMLEAGWPVDTPGEMGATALHWAGFNGNAEMAREILRFHPALELKSREYAGTALAWALFGSGNGWRRDVGDYVGTIRALLESGAMLPEHAQDLEPSDAVLEMLP